MVGLFGVSFSRLLDGAVARRPLKHPDSEFESLTRPPAWRVAEQPDGRLEPGSPAAQKPPRSADSWRRALRSGEAVAAKAELEPRRCG